MKDEVDGGSAAESQLRERLARHFSEELGRAETDYRKRREPEWVDVGRLQPRRRMKLRLAAEGLAVVVLLVIGMVGSGQARTPATPAGPTPSVSLASGLARTPSTSGGPAASSAVVLGADGIPTQIDGQTVYRIGDKATWQNLSGSFLLTGYVSLSMPSCPPPQVPMSSAESHLLGYCGSTDLSAGRGVLGPNDVISVAPKSAGVYGWRDGPAVVVRVHTHDAEVAGCSLSERSRCDSAVVVEAVVWPVVPTEIGGERVYRASDQAVFPKSGSFLLGGPFVVPDVHTSCVARAMSTAQLQLIPYCYIISIDGLGLPRMSTIDEPKDEIVVARVHVNDPLAAQCPAAVQASCKASIVVEAVVWRTPAS